MNTCLKCRKPTDYDSHLCESCYARRASHLHSIIKPQARQQSPRLLAFALTMFLLMLLFAALLYDYNKAHAASPHDLLFQLIVDINYDRLGGTDEPAYHGECGVQNASKGYAKVVDVDGFLSLSDLVQDDTYQIDCYRMSYRFVAGEVNGAAAIPLIVPGGRVWLPGVRR